MTDTAFATEMEHESWSGMGITRLSGDRVEIALLSDGIEAGAIVLTRQRALRAGWALIRAALRRY